MSGSLFHDHDEVKLEPVSQPCKANKLEIISKRQASLGTPSKTAIEVERSIPG
jgi:hypothetical protein